MSWQSLDAPSPHPVSTERPSRCPDGEVAPEDEHTYPCRLRSQAEGPHARYCGCWCHGPAARSERTTP